MVHNNDSLSIVDKIKKSRTVKVFISSTFRDMHEERDELIRNQFVKLRNLCEKRGVIWSEVDLRWGVTDEQKAEGQVLPVCIEEIDNCLPFFIGLLGERYGWIPELEEELLQKYEWLHEHKGKSVTEIEMHYGGLQHNEHAMFYFRDPHYIEKVPADKRADYDEIADAMLTAEEIKHRKQSLQQLKERILQSGRKVRENYKDSAQLGQLVYEDVKAVIDQWFPVDEVPDPLAKEIYDHDCYSKVRSDFFVGRETYLQAMTNYVNSAATKPLYVYGESGIGKSALLSKWYQVQGTQLVKNGTYVIGHFVGATGQKADSLHIVSRIVKELNKAFHLQEPIPTSLVGLGDHLQRILQKASERGNIVIVLDAVNQLAMQSGQAQAMPKWLPKELPANVRMIVSTISQTPSYNLFVANEWQPLEVLALTKSEQQQFISQYLLKFGKHLQAEVIDMILQHPFAKNPIFLMPLLEEIRIDGRENIGDVVEHYLASNSIEELFEKRIKRLEKDFGKELVEQTLSFLLVAQNGLTEDDLRGLLGTNDKLVSAIWSPFYISLESNLVNNGGIMYLFHSYLREAIIKSYSLQSDQALNVYRRKIVHYMQTLPYKETPRFSVEMLSQLYSLQDWLALADELSDVTLMESLWEDFEDLLHYWWSGIELFTKPTTNSKLPYTTVLTVYEELITAPVNYNPEHVKMINELCKSRHLQASMGLTKYLHDYYGEQQDIEQQLAMQELLGSFQVQQGQYTDALQLYEKMEHTALQIGSKYYEQLSVGGQARCHGGLGASETATDLLKLQLELCEAMNDKFSLQSCLKDLCLAYIKSFHLDQAYKLYDRIDAICHEMNEQYELQELAGLKAELYFKEKKIEDALFALEHQQQICEEYGYNVEEVSCILRQAEVLSSQTHRNNVRIKTLIDRARERANELDVDKIMLEVLRVLTQHYMKTNRPLVKQNIELQLDICDRLQLHNKKQIVLGQKVTFHRENLQYAEAMETIDQQIALCEQFNIRQGLIHAYRKKVDLLDVISESMKAWELAEKAIVLCEELNNIDQLVAFKLYLVKRYRYFGQVTKAIALLEELAAVCREHHLYNRLNKIVFDLGNIYMLVGDFAAAKRNFESWNPLYGKKDGTPERIELCNKALNGESYELKDDYIDLYTLDEYELEALRVIAQHKLVTTDDITEIILQGDYAFTKEYMNENAVLSILLRKNVVKTRKLNLNKAYYSITDLGQHRLQQVFNEHYDVTPYFELEDALLWKTHENFLRQVVPYLHAIGDVNYKEGDTFCHVDVHGQVEEVFMYLHHTKHQFKDYLLEQLEQKRPIRFVAETKAMMQRHALMEFYRLLKERYGNVRLAANDVTADVTWFNGVVMRNEMPLTFTRLKFGER